MRDTAKARVERAHSNIQPIGAALKRGRGGAIQTIDQAANFAEVAVAPVAAPAHGAEFARSMLFFTEQLMGKPRCEEVAAQYDANGVIWRPADQLRAAAKQIGRMRSDAVKAGVDTIPITTLVYATQEGDFVGTSYVQLHDVKLPLNKSTGPEIKLRVGRSWLPVRVAQLRYVEAPMIRAR